MSDDGGDQKFWPGQNVFVVLAGGGVVVVPEHHIYGAILILLGMVGFGHSIWSKAMNKKSALWIIALLLTWGSIGYDYYDRHHGNANWGEPSHRVIDRRFTNTTVPLDDHHFINPIFENVTLEYEGTGPVQVDNAQFVGGIRVISNNPAVMQALAVQNSMLKMIGCAPGMINLGK